MWVELGLTGVSTFLWEGKEGEGKAGRLKPRGPPYALLFSALQY